MQVVPGTWRLAEAQLIGRRMPKTPAADTTRAPGSLRERGMYPETRRYVKAVLSLRGRL